MRDDLRTSHLHAGPRRRAAVHPDHQGRAAATPGRARAEAARLLVHRYRTAQRAGPSVGLQRPQRAPAEMERLGPRPATRGDCAQAARAGSQPEQQDHDTRGVLTVEVTPARRIDADTGDAMELGLFLMPSHPPERGLLAGQQWDLAVLREADRLGYSEAWIGEHFTAPWEPNPAPDVLIAQALMQTRRIRLAPGAHLLPYHHPAELACRAAFMDHLAQGRYMFGVGAGGLPSDWKLFCVDGAAGQNREMTRESLDIILKIWESDGGLEYHGKYWNVSVPNPMMRNFRHHVKPFQKPHPPIGIAGISPGSATLKLAGERGFIPMSLNLSTAYCASHWQAVLDGAARTGRQPTRDQWRIVREIFVADTDDEAYS